MKDLAVNDDDPDLIMGAIEEGWVVQSRDGGASWEQIDRGVPHDSHTLRFVPGMPGTLVMGSNDGWLRSDDGGSTWTAANDGLDARRYTPAPLLTRSDQPKVLFSAVTGVGPGGWNKPGGGDAAFCRSDNGGHTWRTLTNGLPQPMAAIPRAIAIDPGNPEAYVAGTTDGCLWATDDGDRFTCVLSGLGTVMSLAPARLG